MAKRHPHLTKQAGSQNWQVRRRVPLDLQKHLGKKVIWRSLKTPCHKEALRRLPEVEAALEDEFGRARRHVNASQTDAIPDAELIRIAQQVFQDSIGEFAEEVILNPESVEVLMDVEIDELRMALEEDAWSTELTNAADHILHEHGYTLPRCDKDGMEDEPAPTPGFLKARSLITRAKAAANRTIAQRAIGDFSYVFGDPLVTAPKERATTAAPNVTSREQPVTDALSLEDLIKRFMGDPARSGLSEKTKTGYRTIFNILRDLIGPDTPVTAITRERCRHVREVLMALPPNFTKRWPGVSAEEVAAIAKRDGIEPMKAKTVNSYLNNLSALFRWAAVEEYMDKNPAERLSIDDSVQKRDRKMPFSSKQLQAIFSAPIYTGCKDDEAGYATSGPERPRRGRFWVPLLALWTGMRLNECCQLDVADIKKMDGVWCIVIGTESEHGDDDKRVKTEAGHRFVPVHPKLKKIGFLEYVKTMRGCGERKLFPDLPMGGDGYYSGPFSKWFARFLDKADAKAPRTSFHSFRHSYRDALREAGISPERVKALGGWTDGGSVDEAYGGGFKPHTLLGEISKVKYPSLDLDHLMHQSATSHP